MKFKSNKLLIPLLLILIILSVGVFIQYSLGLSIFRDDVKSYFLNSFIQVPFNKQSQAGLKLNNSKLEISLNLTDQDKPVMKQFLSSLNQDQELSFLSLELDKNAAASLAPLLPVTLNLKVSPNTLEFKSQSVASLQNAFIQNNFEFATGSGKLKLNYSDTAKFQLQVQNPQDLVSYATSSGTLTISSKLEGLFKSLPKIATIEMNVNGKNISGQISLK